MEEKRQQLRRRHQRARAKIAGTPKLPRLCVFRSNKHIYAQLIDDEKGRALISASDLELKHATQKQRKSHLKPKEIRQGKRATAGKVAISFEVGKLIAEKALKKKIGKVVFDRGGYKYHGRVKAVAEGAREGGLKF